MTTKPNAAMMNFTADITAHTEPLYFSNKVAHAGRVWGEEVAYTASDMDTGSNKLKPMFAFSATFDADEDVGANARTIPLGLYVQHEQTGGASGNTAYTHSIMAYACNNAIGDNDVIALTGRARKLQQTGGTGDAAGLWGTGYNHSDQDGAVMGAELGIRQEVAGSAASDSGSGISASGAWTMGLHLVSLSEGSAANVAIDIDGPGNSAGQWGFWNGIILDKTAFGHNGTGNGVTGTVGLNMASWTASQHAETAIKFGFAEYHLSYPGNTIVANANKISVKNASGSAGLVVNSASSSYDSFIDFNRNSVLLAHISLDNPTNDFDLATFAAAHDIVVRPNDSEVIRFNTDGYVVAALPTGAGSAPGALPSNGLWVDTSDGRTVKSKA